MEAVLLIGIMGAGKSTFYARRFAATHARINLDTLKTRVRERKAVEACLAEGRPFVVDNTNLLAFDRARYIPAARAAGYRVTGYRFDCPVEDCQERNARREGRAFVPPHVIAAAIDRLEEPSLDEGFDALFRVTCENGDFQVIPWNDGG